MILANKIIDIIYHLADIHIRPLERHIEYREVFENLYSFLKSDNEENSLIVICGDIIHEKDKITPELIILLREFIKNLSDITDVLLFSGNHDLIENNNDRIPNLEALTQDIKNIYYLKNSDNYEFENVIFSLSSLEDKKGFKKLPKTSKIKIALYHGMLKEISFSNGGLSVNDFSDYDYVLLGDVHERQYLKENIAYCGSLIQQNFGETLQNHGFIKWNIKENDSYNIDIPNNYGFVTINDINDNVLKNMPKNSRIRYNLTNDKIEDIQQMLNTNIISEKILKFKNKEQKINYHKDFTKNINDEDIIKNELENKDKLDEILKLHTEIKKECNFNLINASEHKWSILNLEFMNLFIYGNNELNKINFENKNGVIGILGNNAIGKSSIINIILFSLFDKISSEYNNTNVINKNCKKMYVKIEFEISNTRYIIEKKGTIQNSKNNTKTRYETNYKKIENQIEINLNGKDRIKTQKFIDETIMTQDIYILCNIISNTHSSSILNMTNTEILNVFSNLFKLEKYQDLEKNISGKIKELNNTLNQNKGKLSLLKDIDKNQIERKKLELSDKKTNILENNKKILIKETEYKNIIKDLENIKSKIIKIEKPNKSEQTLLNRQDELIELIDNNININSLPFIEILYQEIDNEYTKNIDENINNIENQLKSLKKPIKIIDNKNDLLLELNGVNVLLKNKTEEISNYQDYNIRNKYLNYNLDKLEAFKTSYKLREIKDKKILNKVSNKKLTQLTQRINKNEEIIFYNCKQISSDIKNIKKELKIKNFLNKNNNYNKKETDDFIELIQKFVDNFKEEKDLSKIKTKLTKDKEDLFQLNKLKMINE